jgi:hypothetical protein
LLFLPASVWKRERWREQYRSGREREGRDEEEEEAVR